VVVVNAKLSKKAVLKAWKSENSLNIKKQPIALMREHVIATATLVKIGGDQIFSAGGAFDSADPNTAEGTISSTFPMS
jgi:hypothetical protein